MSVDDTCAAFVCEVLRKQVNKKAFQENRVFWIYTDWKQPKQTIKQSNQNKTCQAKDWRAAFRFFFSICSLKMVSMLQLLGDSCDTAVNGFYAFPHS